MREYQKKETRSDNKIHTNEQTSKVLPVPRRVWERNSSTKIEHPRAELAEVLSITSTLFDKLAPSACIWQAGDVDCPVERQRRCNLNIGFQDSTGGSAERNVDEAMDSSPGPRVLKVSGSREVG